ncbi:unnamed protein product [Didymodactylos carnosus]|uniref:Uncharacterized protein n=1 Tax=Didymodactylos carnosus TaxID=1234261 RepID=A0A8S2F0Z7_9BILA|nr:unnamed protein product [Didymodactylos carnosus]CAF4160309.1 unnamed protein product [Didymodactylos carnosus]
MELEFPIMHDAELIQAEAGARQPMKKTKLRQEQRILNILNDTSTTNLEKVILQSQDMNIDDSISATTASTIIPSTALTVGIDLRTVTADPSSHTRFIRESVRRSGLATNPDALFDNKAQVLEIKKTMLQNDTSLNDETLMDIQWNKVKASLRQLKRDVRKVPEAKKVLQQTTSTSLDGSGSSIVIPSSPSLTSITTEISSAPSLTAGANNDTVNSSNMKEKNSNEE